MLCIGDRSTIQKQPLKFRFSSIVLLCNGDKSHSTLHLLHSNFRSIPNAGSSLSLQQLLQSSSYKLIKEGRNFKF